MRQRSNCIRVLQAHQAIHHAIHSQKRRHSSHGAQVPALQEDARNDAESQVAATHALHETGCESVVLDGHAEARGEGGRAQHSEESGAEQEPRDAVVGEELERLLVGHVD